MGVVDPDDEGEEEGEEEEEEVVEGPLAEVEYALARFVLLVDP